MWFLLSLGSAVFDAAKNVFAKRNLRKEKVHPLVVAWAWVFYALPITLPIALFAIPSSLSQQFWWAALLALLLDFISILLFVKALEKTDLSLSLPMLAMVPLVLLITGSVINEELPGPLGLIGVFLIVGGAYFLNYNRHRSHFLSPILAIFHNRGSALMFGVAIIWGLTSALHKVAISHSNPYFYTGFIGLGLTLAYTPFAYYFDRKNFLGSFKPSKIVQIAPVGLMDGISVLLQFIAQNMAFSVFVIAIKRSSIMMSSVAGAVFFKEKIKDRLLPIGVMLLGVVAIALSNM